MRAIDWFLGVNDQIPLIELSTGLCLNGLHPDRANANGGAESVLSYLLGLAEPREFERAALAAPALPLSKLVNGIKCVRTSSSIPSGSRLVPTPILEPAFTPPEARSRAGKYSIGAVLLDKSDPSKVLAPSREPLVRPERRERRVRPQCGLGVRGHASGRLCYFAVRYLRHILEFCDNQNCGAAERYRRVARGRSQVYVMNEAERP